MTTVNWYTQLAEQIVKEHGLPKDRVPSLEKLIIAMTPTSFYNEKLKGAAISLLAIPAVQHILGNNHTAGCSCAKCNLERLVR